MTGAEGFVCPRCGAGATGDPYCHACGLHLVNQPHLPTRQEWKADHTTGEGPAHESSRQPNPPYGTGRRRRGTYLAVPAAVLATAVVTVVLLISGSGTHQAASRPVSQVTAPPVPQESDAQICTARWNAEASQLDLQIAGGISAKGDYAAAGFQSTDPNDCLITFSNGTGGTYSSIMQFDESGGQFQEGASGTAEQLPGDWTWNARSNGDGTVSALG